MKLPPFITKITHNPRFSSRVLTYVWYRHYKLWFAILFLGTLLWGGYLWYFNIYQYRWSDAQKKEYLQSHFKETSLKEKEFQMLVQGLRDRAGEYKTAPSVERNIFDGVEEVR